MPKLTSNEKNRFFQYLKDKGRLDQYQSNLPQSASNQVNYSDLNLLFDLMIEDLVSKSGRSESKEVFEDYIFSSALVVMEKSLDEDQQQTLKQELDSVTTSDEYLSLLLSYLSDYKNIEQYITGVAFSYAKLAYKLKVEPNPEYLAIVEILELINN
ncbi:MAG: hypothetical protein AAGF07_02995 [Patescibacteria group bacterium]